MPVIVGASGTGSEGKSDRMGLPTGTSDPGSAAAGDMYYKTDDKKIRVYDGSAWADLASGGPSVAAAGGTETAVGAWKVHTFTTTGSDQAFEVTAGPVEIEYLLVGGGGGGGGTSNGSSWSGGGGGGGGVVHGTTTLPVGTYKVRVGEGGTGCSVDNHQGPGAQGEDGEDTRLFPNTISNEQANDVLGIVAYGGGGGGSRDVGGEAKTHTGRSGGCGGGMAGINMTQNQSINMAWGAYTQVLRKTGDPTASSDVPFASAGGSVDFDGDDSFYIRHKKELQIEQHDFCLEFWIKAADFGQGDYKVVTSKGSNTNQTMEFALELMGDGKLDWYYSEGGQNWSNESDCTSALADGTWNHVVFLRRGSKFACFTNGTRTKIVTNHNYKYYSNHRRNTTLQHKKEGGDYTIGSYDCSTNYYCQIDNSNNAAYYYNKQTPGQYGFTGKISNYRHVIGHSVYNPDVTNINVPTEKLTAIPGTVLLCCQHFNQAQYDDVSVSSRAPMGGWYSRQGWDGGRNYQFAGCGGGGACGSGSPAKPNLTHKACNYNILSVSTQTASELYTEGGAGGQGYTTDINGTSTTYGGGGGGGSADNHAAGNSASGASNTYSNGPGGPGGSGGGARGGSILFSGTTIDSTRSNYDGQDATDGLGGGGGGAGGGNIKRGGTASTLAHGGDGGNGIAIIRYNLVGGAITDDLSIAPTTSTGSPFFGIDGSGDKSLENTTDEPNLRMGTGDFTIDGFFRCPTDHGSESCWKAVFSLGPGYNDQNSITMYYTQGSGWPVKTSSTNTDYDLCAHLIVSQDYNLASQRRNIDDGDWHHFAIAKTGGFIKQWIDGAFHFEAVDTNDYQDGRLYIGRSPACGTNTDNGQHRGWVNSLRIIKGEALYTGRSGITVPRSKVVATTNGATAGNVKFLGCQSTTDVTACAVTPTNSWTLSANGSVTLQSDLYTPF